MELEDIIKWNKWDTDNTGCLYVEMEKELNVE
jgi:hypothetical protein